MTTARLDRKTRLSTNPKTPAITANLIAFCVFCSIQAFLFASVLKQLFSIWLESSSYHQGLFALPLAAVMVWIRRVDAPACMPNASSIKLSMLLIAPFLVLAILGRAFEINLFQHLALAGIIVAGFITSFGIAFSRFHLPALCMIFLMVPLGDAFYAPFQYTTSVFVSAMFHLTQLDIIRDGFYLTTSSGVFHVAQACAGIGFVSSAIMIALFYGAITMPSNSDIVRFTSLAAVIAICVNMVRAWLMVLVATLSEMRLATGVDHLYFGWLMYFVTFCLIILMGRHWLTHKETKTSNLTTSGV